MSYLERLKEQRAALEAFLQLQKACSPVAISEGVRITMEIYTMILEDAINTASSLVQYLENKPVE